METGIQLIAQERQRQIEQEGWSDKHDDHHVDGELAKAAACYAVDHTTAKVIEPQLGDPYGSFPWDPEHDKRGKQCKLNLLTKAGALLAAEIDRLQRKYSL